MMKNLFSKLTMGIMTILALGLLATAAVKAGSRCYPSSGNCLTLAQYYHTVWNRSGSYWDAGEKVIQQIQRGQWTI